MVIIHERHSIDGNLNVVTLQDVSKTYKANNAELRGFNGPQVVIWTRLNGNKVYPIVFPSIEQRDAAYEFIRNRETAVLEFENYFERPCIPGMTDRKLHELINIKISNHLRICVNEIVKREEVTLTDILQRDAFRMFNAHQLTRVMRKESIKIALEEKVAQIWAKTLYVPGDITRLGITNLQFYKTILKNEEQNFNVRCSTDSFICM